jgi:hypothetical protein
MLGGWTLYQQEKQIHNKGKSSKEIFQQKLFLI